jgi:hypothetical protein
LREWPVAFEIIGRALIIVIVAGVFVEIVQFVK